MNVTVNLLVLTFGGRLTCPPMVSMLHSLDIFVVYDIMDSDAVLGLILIDLLDLLPLYGNARDLLVLKDFAMF